MICAGERDDIRMVLRIADQWGYGNLIAWLRTAWAAKLIKEHGLPLDTAIEATNSTAYPFEMLKRLGRRVST